MPNTVWCCKETIIWPPHMPIYTYAVGIAPSRISTVRSVEVRASPPEPPPISRPEPTSLVLSLDFVSLIDCSHALTWIVGPFINIFTGLLSRLVWLDIREGFVLTLG